MLARNRDLSAAAARVLLHAGDAMITGVIQLDFAVARIDRQPLLIAEKCVARLILTAGGVRMFAKFFWPPAHWRFHGRHWFHFRHGFHTFQSDCRSVRNFQRSVPLSTLRRAPRDEADSAISHKGTAEGMAKVYERFGISPDRIANVVAFAIDQPEDTTINEFTVGPANQPW